MTDEQNDDIPETKEEAERFALGGENAEVLKDARQSLNQRMQQVEQQYQNAMNTIQGEFQGAVKLVRELEDIPEEYVFYHDEETGEVGFRERTKADKVANNFQR